MSPGDFAQRPRIWVPPPALFAAGLLAAWGLDRWIPMPILSAGQPGASVAGWLLCGLGAGLSGWAMVTFGMERTPVLPLAPARTVVTRGPYRFSRNPIYLGLALIYAGVTLMLNTLWALLLLPVALVLLYFLVIQVEERHMRERFGDTYETYRRSVRRWL
jgi:protein-S-isoprenylcysteine O-methyltransferase Ste14